MMLDGEALRLFTRTAGLRYAQRIVSKYVGPDESLANELISERRRKAQGDDG